MSDHLSATKEIVQFFKDVQRPRWQQEAALRIIQKGTISELDLEELFLILKDECNIPLPEGKQKIIAKCLEEEHLQNTEKQSDTIRLLSVGNSINVNRISEEAKIDFAPSMTVVYGNNGSGKSGYTRMLKKACSARAHEKEIILPNVYEDNYSSKDPASMEFEYELESEDGSLIKSSPLKWNVTQEHNNLLRRIRIFDSKISSEMIQGNNEAAFPLPYNIDLFERLKEICDNLKTKLNESRQAVQLLQSNLLKSIPDEFGARNEVVNYIKKNHIELENCLNFSDKDSTELNEAQVQLNSPDLYIKKLQDDKVIVCSYIKRITDLKSSLNSTALNSLKADLATLETATIANELAKNSFNFEKESLAGIGSSPWRDLWEAARAFSIEVAYKNENFPVLESQSEKGKCPLCLQTLEEDAIKRFERFEEFVSDRTNNNLQAITNILNDKYNLVKDIFFDAVKELASLDRIKEYDVLLPTKIENLFLNGIKLKNLLLDGKLFSVESKYEEFSSEIDTELDDLVKLLDQKILETIQSKTPENIDILKNKVYLLNQKKTLSAHVGSIKQFSKYSNIIDQFSTADLKLDSTVISTKKSKLVKRFVNDKFINILKEECEKIGVKQKPTFSFTSPKSKTHHKTNLEETTYKDIHKILSEGEQKAIAFACFVAEARMVSKFDTIIFDDPMCSLDHHFREKVADRIVELSKDRQIIVFTHDLVFLSDILENCVINNVTNRQFVLTYDDDLKGATGKPIKSALPWVAQSVKDRISYIESQYLPKLSAISVTDPLYAVEARSAGKMLRETWERLIEEKLFSKTVERYRDGIRTMSLYGVQITDEIYEMIYQGVSKTSHWAHDTEKAKGDNPPKIAEITNQIKQINDCLSLIKSAQEAAKKNRTDPDYTKSLQNLAV